MNAKQAAAQQTQEKVKQLQEEELELITKLSQTQNKVLEVYESLTAR